MKRTRFRVRTKLVNMRDNEVIHIALENLKNNVGITGKWKDIGADDLDGMIDIKIENRTTKFNIEVKKELRIHQLPKIIEQAKHLGPLMIVAYRIFPKIKEELRQRHIAYLEANGNIYLNEGETMVWIDTQKPFQPERDKGNRAFTKTGLKVVFQFLIEDNLINRPYREIAEQTGTAAGNITNIIRGLKQEGFILPVTKNEYKYNNKQQLLNKWIAAYDLRLKPDIKIGTFRFLKDEDFTNWKKLPFHDSKTRWGGEPAGDLLTNNLRPAKLTIYTNETRNDLIKKYQMIPDQNGNVEVYEKFWKNDQVKDNIAPPLLVYADLINANDRRCTETAKRIYDELLQNKF